MLSHRFLAKDDVLLVHPKAPLSAEDFQHLADKVDPIITQRGSLARRHRR